MAAAASAVPAKPGLITYTQPDGSEVKVRLCGDERAHFYLSEDGYLLTNDKGTFYYADAAEDGALVKSEFRLSAPRDSRAEAFVQSVDMTKVRERLAKRATLSKFTPAEETLKTRLKTRAADNSSQAPYPLGPGLFPDASYPAYGDQKGLVILVEYNDVKMTVQNPADYFSRMLNEDGFSDYKGTGSAREYFIESSMNAFRPEFDVYGPVTLSRNMSYYGGNDRYGNDKNPERMIIEACELIDDEIDFSEYDRDGDGIIDNVFVFYAGRGEASGGDDDTIWPHAYNITYAFPAAQYMFDGVQLDRYACSNEWEGTRPDGVGTFIHEFSHVMGLPDLYDTFDQKGAAAPTTPGSWSVMDVGPYNNNGCTPPLYSAFERYALGWIEPMVLDKAADISLPAIGENVAAIVNTSNPNEYFLFENRQKTSWDKYIPWHGMLIWHIDYNDAVWDRNEVNNTKNHQYVDIVEASVSQERTYSFPGLTKKTEFTYNSNPAMETWAKEDLETPITDIAETDGIITFKVKGGNSGAVAITTDSNSLDCTAENGNIIVSGLTEGSEARAFDLAGKAIASGNASSDGTVILNVSLPGLYIIRASGQTAKLLVK